MPSSLNSESNLVADSLEVPTMFAISSRLNETYGYEKDTSIINVSLSREEIANIVGTSRESATRLLSEFKEDGILELDNKKIKILNQDKLIKTANIID